MVRASDQSRVLLISRKQSSKFEAIDFSVPMMIVQDQSKPHVIGGLMGGKLVYLIFI
jgi:hypothetical protein